MAVVLQPTLLGRTKECFLSLFASFFALGSAVACVRQRGTSCHGGGYAGLHGGGCEHHVGP